MTLLWCVRHAVCAGWTLACHMSEPEVRPVRKEVSLETTHGKSQARSALPLFTSGRSGRPTASTLPGVQLSRGSSTGHQGTAKGSPAQQQDERNLPRCSRRSGTRHRSSETVWGSGANVCVASTGRTFALQASCRLHSGVGEACIGACSRHSGG